LPDRPLPDPDAPEVTHTITRQDSRIEVRTQAGDRVFTAVVIYAFGTRSRYVTMISRDQDKIYRGLRLSYFRGADGSGWGRTSGDVGRSDSSKSVQGQKIDVRDGVLRCLFCHVTQSRDFRDPPPAGGAGPESRDPGIGCERCHGPGGNHLRAVEADFADRAIVNVADAPAATINGQCAECHTVGPPTIIASAPADPRFARSPGLTLTFSRCYTDSNGGLSCVTCHDPHREAEHSAAFYQSKCLSCHSSQEKHSAPARAAEGPPGTPAPSGSRSPGKTCPVNPANDCLRCHMTKVPMPDLHTTLTDHYIRIRDRGTGG
jgi:hypothetical protein